ncbi:MAG: hypothetical protein ACM3ZC_03660 [Bacteroidota bacterium]
MGKQKAGKHRDDSMPVTPEQAEERLQIILEHGRPDKIASQIRRFLETAGEAGCSAAIDCLVDGDFDPWAIEALADGLAEAGPKAAGAILQAWPRLSLATRKVLLATGLSADFLPCFREAAASADPSIRALGCIRLLDLGHLEAAEPLLDLAVSPRVAGPERRLAAFFLSAGYRRHGTAAFPSFWDADPTRYERLMRHVLLMGPGSNVHRRPIDADGHTAAIRVHLADADPALRLRAVENAFPERLADEEWRQLFADPDPEVRRAAVDRAPANDALRETLLELLATSADMETRVIISDRSDLPADRLLPLLAELVASPGLGTEARIGFALRLCGLVEEGHAAPSLEPAIRSLISSDDFRLRYAGHSIRRELGREADHGPLDALLFDLLDLSEERAAGAEDLARKLAAHGAEIIRPLMEAATFILADSPANKAKNLALTKLGWAAAAPILLCLARDADADLAAEAAASLGAFAPSAEAWEALMGLWREEKRPHVMLSMLQGADAWPAWRAGGFFLRVIEGDYPLTRRANAIDLAINKQVPGLGRTALRLLASEEAPDLTEKLYEALVSHLRETEEIEEEIERLNPEGDAIAREVLLHALDELEREMEEEED